MARLGWACAAAAALALGSTGCGSRSAVEDPLDNPPPPPPPPPPVDPGFRFGTQGPWPIQNVVYGRADGILESPVVAVTTDEAQNRWVATPRALYLLRPGDKTFRRLDELDGLNLGAITGREPGPVGWEKYCDMRPVADDAACRGEVVWGGASGRGIRSLVGGAAGEVFVGYHGEHTPDLPLCEGDPGYLGYDDCDPKRHGGKIDRVRLEANGAPSVTRLDFFSNAHGFNYWHNRTASRLAYDHFVNRGTLYVGTEHGVDIIFPDRWTPFTGAGKGDLAAWVNTWFGDHLHALVCYHKACDGTGSGLRMGGWEGLAIDADGQLWHAGHWTAGRISWDPDPLHWMQRNGAAFTAGFGDPYPSGPNDEGFENEPVFKVAQEGDFVRLSGVAVCPDGRVWFSSWGPETGTAHTVAVWTGRRFDTWDATHLGLGTNAVEDIACLPDGRVVLASRGAGLVLYDPAAGTSKTIRAGDGIPSDQVIRLEVDRMTDPPSLHVATTGGAAVLRVLP